MFLQVKMSNTVLVFYLLTIICKFSNGASKDTPAILIISFDGFRFDYVDGTHTPNIEQLKTKGAYGSLINVFETKTFPNHQSLATGLYPESHGVLANSVFDPLYGKVLNYSKELWLYNDAVTPIWVRIFGIFMVKDPITERLKKGS
jgi:ectonucleotide pyrophosphatase/phosphodiesterase family protein 5